MKKRMRTNGVVKSAMNRCTSSNATLNAVQIQRALSSVLLLEFAVVKQVCGTERAIAVSGSKVDGNGSVEGWGR
jgi:hypothetical protein